MTGYPVAQPNYRHLSTPPKHPDLTHYPRWSKSRNENIVSFRNFLYVNGKGDDLPEFDRAINDAPSDIHWAAIAERFVNLHWMK